MKKINSIKQLKEEKQNLSRRKAELEKAIKYDWRDVKESLNPLSKVNSFFFNTGKNKDSENKPSFIADNISVVVTNYAEKLRVKFEQKLKEWLKQDNFSAN